MNKALAKVVTHREFLKMCGLAVLGAGAGQVVTAPQSALAEGPYSNLTVTGYAYLATSSGNVGIGTQTPATKLEVEGSGATIRIHDTNAGTKLPTLELRLYDGNWGTRIQGVDYGAGAGLSFDTSDGSDSWGTRMVIRHSGNVGIGTTAPSQKLEVSGSNEPLIQVKNTGMAGNPYLVMGMNAGNNAAIFQATSGKDFKFHNGQYALTVLGSNGNVGIGTNNPVSALNVERAAYSGAIQPVVSISGAFQDVTAGRSIDYYINNTTYAAGRIANVTDSGGSQGILAFHTSANFNNTSATEKMRITGTGYVGIGTNAPEERLHVVAGGAIKIGTRKIADDGGSYYA